MQREAKERKRVLLVAGTGTLGGPTYAELARLGHSVDVNKARQMFILTFLHTKGDDLTVAPVKP